MRYTLLTALTVVVAGAGITALRVDRAAGQAPSVQIAPAPPRGSGGAQAHQFLRTVHIGQPLQLCEEQDEELGKLHALDGQLAHEAESLARQLAEASDEKQRGEFKDKLRDALAQQFDAQQKARELEVARIEARVKKLRETISKRNDSRRSILDKRLDQLLSEAEGLGWNSPAGSYGPFFVETGLYPPAAQPLPVRP